MKTLVIGASTKPERYSYQAIERLKAKNYPVVALGLKAGDVLGETIHTAKEAWADIDTVSLYVGPAHQDNYIDYVIGLNPRRVLFNPGTENPAFESRLKAEGISAERACTLVLLSTNQY
jgi:predicted CoA-binding protein